MRIIASIQYLRGLAASAVVVHHAAARYDLPFHAGAAGVDMFFVISGFIMWLVTRKDEANAATFLKDRLVRIVPMYWFATAVLAIAAALRPNLFPLDHPLPWHMIQSLLFVPHYVPETGQALPLLAQGWTLNYEMFFYTLFGLVLLSSATRQLWSITAALAACVTVGLFVKPSDFLLHTYTSPLLLEFLAGIWLAHAWTKDRWPSAALGWVSLCVGAVALLFVELAGAPAEGSFRVVLWGVPAFLIVSGTVTIERGGQLPRSAVMHLLGNGSYSIYLTHTLSMTLIALIVEKLGFSPGPWIYLLTIAGGLLIGTLCFLWVERPFTAFIRNVTRARGFRRTAAVS
ncbi:exopolysaccharide production protein ExoZ [Rhizobiales bacterium GAS188]|nr:exopolysaccharide production protein ExoZ [Rhizobiales bacterium GAS188]